MRKKQEYSHPFQLEVRLAKSTNSDYKMLTELADRNRLGFLELDGSFSLTCRTLKTAQKIELLLINWAGEQDRINGIFTSISKALPSHPKVRRYRQLYGK
jgi:hypothetical protein